MVAQQQQHGAIVATYTYQDASGLPAYRVIRYDPKDFRQQHYDRGDWHSGLGAYRTQPLPYHLPRVMAAIGKRPVFIVEGEKDVEQATARLDLVATCNNGGAGHWGAAQSAYLRGADVVILPDNDVAGRSHAAIAARHLHDAQAASIRILVLPELFGGCHIKDISDFIAAGGSRADLYALYQAAPLYRPGDLDNWLIKSATKVTPTVVKAPTRRIEGDTERYAAWSHAALDNVTSDLASTSTGRFAAMKSAANRLGTIAAHGLLTETECVTALVSACNTNGYEAKCGQRATEDRIRFYFQSGIGHPCDLPAAPDAPIEKQRGNGGTNSPIELPALTVDPQLFKHGLPDRLCAALRRCFHQAVAPTLWIWLAAIAAGLIAADADVDAVMLADCAEQLGLADPERRVKTRYLFRTGLDQAAEKGSPLVDVVEILYTDLLITDKETLESFPNTVSRISTTFRLHSPADIVGVIQQWLPFAVKEHHFPTADRTRTSRKGSNWLVEAATVATPEGAWIDQDTDATLTDIGTQGDLTLDETAAERIAKATRATKADRAYFGAIGTDTTVTAMPANWTFSTAREFTAMRWRALEVVNGIPRPQWQLAQMLGVATSSLSSYRKLAGLKSDPQTVTVCVATAEQAIAAACKAHGFLKVIETTATDGTVQRVPYDPPTAARVIAVAQQKGLEVKVQIQTASRQQIATDAQPKLSPRRATPVIAAKPAAPRSFVVLDTVPVATTPAPKPVAKPVEADAPRVPGYSKKWITGQLVLNMRARGFTERGDAIIHPNGEIVARGTFADLSYHDAITVARGRSLIASESPGGSAPTEDDAEPISMIRAAQLCDGASAAERAARLDGHPQGTGKSKYLATLTSAELSAIARYESDTETW